MIENNEIPETQHKTVGKGSIYTSLHHLDYESKEITEIDVDNQSKPLQEYISRLMTDIYTKPSKRYYEFISNTTEVRMAIDQIFNGEYAEGTTINAERLLNVEIKAQQNNNNLKNKILKGSLFQTIIDVDGLNKIIIIGKADHNDFLDASDFAIHKGLPWKKRIYKSFMASLDVNGNVTNVLVADSTSKISKYWWSDFFELIESRTDEQNTSNFLDAVEKVFLNRIKKNYKADHTTLKNSIIGYFRSNDDFDIVDLYENVFENYVPVDPKLDIKKYSNVIQNIPNDYNIDGQFRIEKKAIKKKAKNVIPLSNSMELVLKDAIKPNDIKAFENKEHEKFIIIKTEEGYNHFEK